MRTLPRTAQVTVGLFGIMGAYGLIRAILVIGPVDYGYLGLLVFLAVVTGRTKVRLIGGSSLSLMTSVVLVAMMMLGTSAGILVGVCGVLRSEERRVGKECRSRWSAYHEKRK